jgi:surface antigen
MYTDMNFKTKKALKDAVAAGTRVGVYQPNDMFGAGDRVQQGTHQVALEGPHYPRPHKWYAEATVVDGRVTKVR